MHTKQSDTWNRQLTERLQCAGITSLVLVGAHASGKSTLRRQLAAVLGWRSDEELGERLRRERQALDPSNHAQLHQPDFDAQVLDAELQRDLETPLGLKRVIETWHPGNLAYASQRSEAVVPQFLPRIHAICAARMQETLVIPLQISPETLAARLHEPGPETMAYLTFLWEVGNEAHAWAKALNLRCLHPLSTDGSTPENTLHAVLTALVTLEP